MAKKIQAKDSGNAITKFFKNEIFAADKRAGNLNVTFGVAVFGASIALLRNFGDLLAV
ncbi:hypothetical protein K493DRAFT_318165 [Basidiobolus meristosporus CBS 931.73]|uniref:Uncharacterized protein n=1 Tax=Basidiobolus meristosporus CBS 931.73 TaxID=1314790 RepID=A0A1Y1XWN9_9FUNG|nr:hypothetical protein K493DRAFT_318165 [Basidiobolus meristosporus CBS 931.73]|eukprot:ORX90169.1 hypothetical protein K493DRAFT_318165 [Basidiobolus meristosporus CBS 931.73]